MAIIHRHNRGMQWRVMQSESTGRFFVVRGYGPGSLDVFGDYARQSSADGMCAFLNGTGKHVHNLSHTERGYVSAVRRMDA